MKLRRVMIAAPRSGSGKTIVTLALLQLLKNQGMQAASYKCGPDYIDPMFHETVIGIPSINLDTFFSKEEDINHLLLNGRTKDDIAVLEGVMGLYDGLGGIREEGSSYHLAKVTETPIILVADVKGMGRSMLAMLSGFLNYDMKHLIQGVILNRISESYYHTIKPLIESELQLPVLGYLPQNPKMHLESRHLGLTMPGELQNIKEKIWMMVEEFCKTVSIKNIIKIAECAGEIQDTAKKEPDKISMKTPDVIPAVEPDNGRIFISTANMMEHQPVIAVARDEAFCFYYADNLRLLREYGANIVFFSPIHDKRLPDICHAILLGGGYPELFAKELSDNFNMHTCIRESFKNGMPVVAECGGFMYMHDALKTLDGMRYDMAGMIPEVCYDTGRLVRFGYVEIQEKHSSFLLEGETIKGHEFHYYDSTDNGSDALAKKPVTKDTYSCIMAGENYWMGFPHLYYPSNTAFAKSFVGKAVIYQKGLE